MAAFALTLAGLVVLIPGVRPTPAEAAAPELGISVTQSTPDSRVGDPVDLTATVSAHTPGQETGQSGWAVEFRGTAGGGWNSGVVYVTDGIASYEHTSQLVGEDQISAVIVNVGCGGDTTDAVTSNTVQHDWWQPQLTLTPVDSVSEIGTNYTVTANLHHGSTPLPGARMLFTVQEVDFSSDSLAEPVTTDSDGNASLTWSKPDVTVEAIRVQELDQEQPAEAGGSHVWDVGADTELTIDLAQSSSLSRVGSGLTITAQVELNGVPAAEQQLLMFSTETNGLSEQTTDANGVATFTKTADEAGPDSLLFYIRGVRGSFSVLHQWWSDPVVSMLPGDGAVEFTGRTHVVAATASFAGAPVAGLGLDLRADNADASTITRSATTGAGGRATFDGWSRSEPGTDQVRVGEPDITAAGAVHAAADIGSTSGSLEWDVPAAVPLAVSLVQPDPAPAVRVGGSAHLVAVPTGVGPVGESEEPADLPNWDVTLRDAASGDEVAQGVSGDGGSGASFDVRRQTAGSVDYVATVDIPGCGRISSQVARVTWALPVLTIEPLGASAPAGSPVRVQAHVTLAGAPLADDPLAFTSTSTTCELPTVTERATTDDTGTATVTLQRELPSLDRLVVSEEDVASPQSAETSITWGTPTAPPITVTLSQSRANDRVGTSVTLTVTVTQADEGGERPAGGLALQFSGADATNRDFVTDENGRVRYSYVRNQPRTDTVTASVPYGCARLVSGTVRHEWWLPKLQLSPDAASTPVGGTASVTATLSHGADGIPGEIVRMRIDSDTASVDTIQLDATTNSQGHAVFAWTRSQAGTDTLTAVELVDVLPQRATAERRWIEPTTPASPTPTAPTTTPPPVPTPEPSPSKPTPSPASPTPSPSGSPAPAPSGLPATATKVDGPEVGRPGGDIQLSGDGCRPGEQVTIRLGDTPLGTTIAAADGSFYLRAAVPELPLGRYPIRSSCGTTFGDPNVDITEPQVNKAMAGIAAVGATTASTFVFFLLIAKGMISFLPKRRG